MIGADMTQSDSLLLQPMTQTCGEQNLPVNRTPGISLRTLGLGKRADVCRERALESSRQNHLVIDDALHGGKPFSPAAERQRVKTMSCQILGCIVKRTEKGNTRQS